MVICWKKSEVTNLLSLTKDDSPSLIMTKFYWKFSTLLSVPANLHCLDQGESSFFLKTSHELRWYAGMWGSIVVTKNLLLEVKYQLKRSILC